MMKTHFAVLPAACLLSVLSVPVSARCGRNRNATDTLTYSDAYLDTVRVERKFMVNDYTLVGMEYGVSLSQVMFNPPQDQTFLFRPNTFALYCTRYGKMFGYLPYFGLKAGLRHTHEGYRFKEDKQTHYTPTLEGADQAVMECVEVPLAAQFHLDMLHFKVMAEAGIYGGYRLNIHRFGDGVEAANVSAFLPTDHRIDYGLTGGLGFALVFDPIEFHVNGAVRYAWSTLYDPDYLSRYYYRFAFPVGIMVTAGIHFQLTRRTGKTRPQLRKEAYDAVYGNNELDRTGR